MTKTFATNSNNDLYLDLSGNITISSDLAALQNICLNVAKSQLGEMVLNTNQGIPNFQAIWSGNPNTSQFEAALRITLLAVNGVTEIISLSTSITNNIIQYNVVINTIYGQISINGQNIDNGGL